MTRIRRAAPMDAQAIHELMVEAFAPFQAQYTSGCFDATVLDASRIVIRMTEGPVFVAELKGQLVGTVSALRDGRGVYVRGIAVHPKARRSGLGRLLLSAIEEFARNQKAPCLWLSTTPFLTGSIALYESFGFRRAPGPEELFGTPLISYEKSLNRE